MGSSLPLPWYHLANWSKLVDLTNRFPNLAHLLYISSSLAQCESVTFVGVLNACACVLALEEGRCAHEQILQSGCESISFVGNSLIEMYAKCWSMEDAWRFVQQDAITGCGLLKCHSWRMCHPWAW